MPHRVGYVHLPGGGIRRDEGANDTGAGEEPTGQFLTRKHRAKLESLPNGGDGGGVPHRKREKGGETDPCEIIETVRSFDKSATAHATMLPFFHYTSPTFKTNVHKYSTAPDTY
uniref:Uncharacterized protein n=1 Tax=Corethron hystrix TaxID=216773 RepID=A0A7S1FVY6_9STRA|mmetsp:Transcript_35080/g.81130  ORF Transcript_35080/g.81130 Transcript_35080/m.81130 type:complete len:114 (+) Transcript_35080:146-487(+)